MPELWRKLFGSGARRRYEAALDRATSELAAGRHTEALATLEQGLGDGIRGYGEGAEELLVAHYAAASAALAGGELERAEAHGRQGAALAARHGARSEPPAHRFLETLAAIEERRAAMHLGAAEGDALEQALRAYADAALRAGDRRAVAAAKNRLGLLLARTERREDAALELSEALAIRRSLGAAEARAALESAYNLATCRPLDQGAGAEALADAASLLDEVVRGTRDASDTAGRELAESALHNLGVVRDERGELDEARRLYERALSLRAKRLGDDHASLRPTLSRLARLEHRAGRLVFALGYYERALAIARRELPEDDPIVRGLERWRDALTSGEGEA